MYLVNSFVQRLFRDVLSNVMLYDRKPELDVQGPYISENEAARIFDNLYGSYGRKIESKQPQKRQAVEFGTYTPDFLFHQWPTPHAIPFEFNDRTQGTYHPVGYEHRSLIQQALNTISEKTGGCIGFEQQLWPNVSLHRIIFTVDTHLKTTARATIGMSENYPNFVLVAPASSAYNLTVGSLMHELLHTLGLLHTHQRLDRNNHVKVNYRNVINERYLVNFDVIMWSSDYGVPYDMSSIMHYNPCVFSKAWADGRCDEAATSEMMIEGRKGEDLRNVIGQREYLSTGDIALISKMYCDPKVQ